MFFVQTYQSSTCEAPVGHFCSSKSDETYIVKCGKGRYQDEKGQTSCKSCKDGEYNIQTGQSKCKVCPVGHSCLHKNKSPAKCRKGSYQDKRGKKFCRTCPISKFCSSTGPVIHKKDTSPLAADRLEKIRNAMTYAKQAYDEVINPADSRLKDGDRTKGFVKYDDNKIVVSFQGSNDINDWYRNVKFAKEDYSGCEDCEVHIGFFQTYNAMKDQMLEKVSALSDEHSDARVLVTGHSLGGAVATFAAVDLVDAGHSVDLITFGSPRVGNNKFSEHVNGALNGLNLRVTNKRDFVTVIPLGFIGYLHVGQEVHCTDKGKCEEYPLNEDASHFRISATDHSSSEYCKI
ncbi:probable feruloyl esterase A [Xenia sp. Carnegie-2017]|uniref:probable feruloyl esterase A n=1 Tax=Xenia sp. Carnegie-2017 TaxID=2897299 RepID=UPI001F039C2C|nr:probable feruloyl esterase A [Xenia sp. Carnegie-2017]